jgi:hypothetical protein
MDARWADVDSLLERSVRHFRMASVLFERHEKLLASRPESERAYEAKMALMHAVQSGYVAFEAMLKKILGIISEEIPDGASSHADLIRRVSRPLFLPGRERPPILGQEAAGLADEARRFRHRSMYAYDEFNPVVAKGVFEACRRLADLLPGEIASFRAQVDPGPSFPVA